MEHERIPPHDRTHLDRVWETKELIKHHDGYLRQAYDFFSTSYENNTAHVYIEDDVAAFAVVRDDGYLLFLGVAPEHRGRGLGRRIVEDIGSDHRELSCHTRENNTNALEFYRHLGFEIQREVEGYYRNGETALYLVRFEGTSLRNKISGVIRGER
ncbi:MAG: GNAT family N-acetyltransferase [Halobacteriota archaeon]